MNTDPETPYVERIQQLRERSETLQREIAKCRAVPPPLNILAAVAIDNMSLELEATLDRLRGLGGLLASIRRLPVLMAHEPAVNINLNAPRARN